MLTYGFILHSLAHIIHCNRLSQHGEWHQAVHYVLFMNRVTIRQVASMYADGHADVTRFEITPSVCESHITGHLLCWIWEDKPHTAHPMSLTQLLACWRDDKSHPISQLFRYNMGWKDIIYDSGTMQIGIEITPSVPMNFITLVTACHEVHEIESIRDSYPSHVRLIWHLRVQKHEVSQVWASVYQWGVGWLNTIRDRHLTRPRNIITQVLCVQSLHQYSICGYTICGSHIWI